MKRSKMDELQTQEVDGTIDGNKEVNEELKSSEDTDEKGKCH